jgi:hypothetical protein
MKMEMKSAFLLALLLASCGGSETSPPRAEESPPASGSAASSAAATSGTCALLHAEEIQEVMGQAPGAPSAAPGTDDCVWPSASAPSGMLVRLTVSDSGYATYDAFVASYGAEFGGEQPPREYYRPIEGVGDWAMFVADENAVQVFQGGKMVQVVTSPPDENQSVALARKVLPRLP